jgi:uncharacterized protein YggE
MKNKILLIFSILVIAGVLSACGPTAAQTPNLGTKTLYINGTGTANLIPDIAYVTIGVHTEAPTAVVAVDMNNTRAQKVMTALQSFGILAKDLRTSNFSIASLQKTDPTTGQSTGQIYYAVDNSVIVTVRDLPKMGDLLDSAIQAGANNINSVQFDVSDNKAALQEARTQAMQNGLDQAKEIAAAAGITLGDIQTIMYSESMPVFNTNTYMDYGKGGGGVRAAPSVPVSPGQMTVTATVTITYAIK